MALIGAILILILLFIRPQEFLPALEGIPALNIATAISVIGVLVLVGTGKLKQLKTPQLPLVGAFIAWCILCTTVKVGVAEMQDQKAIIVFPSIYMLLVAYAAASFERMRVMAAAILLIALGLASLGVHQSLQERECIVLETDENGGRGDASLGTPNGVECESARQCNKEADDYKTDFLCEKPGLFNTFSIGGRVRYRGILGDPNELSLAIGTGLSFAFAFHASSKRAIRHILLIMAIVVVSYCVITTESRGGVLVLLAIFGTYFVRRFGPKGLLLAGTFAAPAILLGGRSGEEADSSALERMGALYEGVDLFRSTPIFGLGAGQFGENYFITAHNSYLLSAAELGFPGMVIWTSLVYVSIKIPVTIGFGSNPGVDPRLAPYGVALTTSFAGFLIGIFFLSFCYHPLLWVFFGMSAALYLVARQSSPTFEVTVSWKEIRWVAVADVILMIILFVYTRIKGSP